MHRVIGATSYSDSRQVARKFHTLVQSEHPTSSAATAAGRVLTIQSITHMFEQVVCNRTEFRFKRIGSASKTAHATLNSAWQDSVVAGVHRHATQHGLRQDDEETWISYCTLVCSTWSFMMLTLGASLGLPTKRFSDSAHWHYQHPSWSTGSARFGWSPCQINKSHASSATSSTGTLIQ